MLYTIVAETTVVPDRDKYQDAPLSGALERMPINDINLREILHKLESSRDHTSHILSQSVMISKPPTDHTYCTMLYGNNIHSTAYHDEDRCHNINVVSQETYITHDFSNLTLDTDEHNYKSIEISMVLEEPEEIPHLSDT